MYRTLVVDDEEPVLNSFKFIIDKYADSFELCGLARSGTEALRIIKEQTPDLVFMDIQMPGIDGIEVIQQLRPLFPNIVFILSTAYERFDIAQKAIRLGIFSYLVKPVSKNKILEELDKVQQYLDVIKKENEDKLNNLNLIKKSKNELQRLFLSALIWNNPGTEEWNEIKNTFSIKSDNGAICLIGGISEISMDIRVDIFKTITKKIQFKYNCLYCDLGDKLLLLFPEERNLKHIKTDIQNIINRVENFNLILGIGSIQHYSEFTNSFSEAYLPFTDNDIDSESIDLQQKEIRYIFKQLLKSDRDNGEAIFKEFWIQIFKKYSFIVAKGKMVAIFSLLIQDIESHILLENKFNIEPAEEIMPLKTMEAWENWAEKAIRTLFNVLEKSKNDSYPAPLNKALSYIAEHYNEKLSLTLVAERCMVSTGYLSRLFSEHMNIKFIDYLNHYRVNKALTLLNDKDITIKEVTYLVGYTDPNYFSRIFRKIKGVSPSDFEKRGYL